MTEPPLALRLDRAARAGLDGDAPQAKELVGVDGAMVYSIDDLDWALRGIYLDMVPLSLEAGAQAEAVAAMLAALWGNRGITPDQARGAFSPYVRPQKRLAARPTACPNRGLRRIGRRRASDMGDGPDERYYLRGIGCP